MDNKLEDVIKRLQEILETSGNIPVKAIHGGGNLAIIYDPQNDIYLGRDGTVHIIS